MPTILLWLQGVKASELFFDKRPAGETPWTQKRRKHDLRSNQHFTLETKPLKRGHREAYVTLYNTPNRNQRAATWSAEPSTGSGRTGPEGRWRAYRAEDIAARDTASR